MAHASQMGVMTTEATKRWRKKQMKEHTITKTLFKMKKKKKTTENYIIEDLGQFSSRGQIREMDLVTLQASFGPKMTATLLFCLLWSALCLLCLLSSSVFISLFFLFFCFVLMITTCLIRTSC